MLAHAHRAVDAHREQAACPAYHRGCYGCFGPKETPNPASLTRQLTVLGMDGRGIDRVFHTFNTEAPGFREVRAGE